MGKFLLESPGIVMTAVYPGVIKTIGGHWEKVFVKIHACKKYFLKGVLWEGLEIQKVLQLFFCSNQASFAHGTIVGIDGGQSRHFLHNNYEP